MPASAVACLKEPRMPHALPTRHARNAYRARGA